MTKKEFYNRYYDLKVHCDTLPKAKAFLALAALHGVKWTDGSDISLDKTYWEKYEVDTNYHLFSAFGGLKLSLSDGTSLDDGDVVEFANEDDRYFVRGGLAYNSKGQEVALYKPMWKVLNLETNYYENVLEDDLLTKAPLKLITVEELEEMGYKLKKE